jgi:hypothetical protein
MDGDKTLHERLLNHSYKDKYNESDTINLSENNKKKSNEFFGSPRKISGLFSTDKRLEYNEALGNLVRSSSSSILCLMFIFLYDNLNVIFASKFLGSKSVSAVGLGSLYLNAGGLIMGIGLLGGVDT